MARVEGRVAVITGAASGIGAACARLLAREGARVVLTDLSAQEGELEAASLRSSGQEALFLHHDVADESSWEHVVDQVLTRFGRLDILVNNAGRTGLATVEQETLEGWRRMLQVNLDGVFLGIKHAMRAMRATPPPRTGSIVNISSVMGIVASPRAAAYSASKGGVRLLSKSAALHGAPDGIRVNSVHPAWIETPLAAGLIASNEDPLAARARLTALHPMARFGRPEEVAHGVLYLASNDASFVTGSELVIDGGYTAQ